MDAREERLARNEVLFRDVNERVREIATTHGNDGHVYDFFCECSNRDCDLRLSLTVREYEAVRARGHWFIVSPGHVFPEIEHVVEHHDGYDVVAKEDDAALLTRQLDPRAQP